MDTCIKNEKSKPIAITIANHWSYIGIGWTAGVESCAASLNDSMKVCDPPWCLRVCINLDAAAYGMVGKYYPEVIERLKEYLKKGLVEITGGTYSQPLGSMISAESNVRQLLIGRETVRDALGTDIATFLEEEEYSHPQLPQLLILSGYRYASLAQCDTWGSSGIPVIEAASFYWRGKDGTVIPCIPKNSLFRHPPSVTTDIEFFETPEGRKEIEKISKTGAPLATVWTEFGWEPLGGSRINKFDPDKHKLFKERSNAVYTTIKEYFETYADPQNSIGLVMDDFDKILPWGIGGDQLRVCDRKAEALLAAAEQLHALISVSDDMTADYPFTNIWKDLLTAQSHDVSLCEYTRWQGGNHVPEEKVIDMHQMPWGSIGYMHQDRALSQTVEILDQMMDRLAFPGSRYRSECDVLPLTVYNPCPWTRDAIVPTGKINLKESKMKDFHITDRDGIRVPSQIIKADRDSDGNIVAFNAEFMAEKIPPAGCAGYFLRPGKNDPDTLPPLIINKGSLEMENKYVRIRMDKRSGSLSSLYDKINGNELLDRRAGFAVFTGRPNRRFTDFFGLSDVPDVFCTADTEPEAVWNDEGPLTASVTFTHLFPHMCFDIKITMHASSNKIDIVCRLCSDVPPAVDRNDINGWQFENRIEEAYWLQFGLGFEPLEIYRDIPFAVEPAAKDTFHALSCVDFVGSSGALLLIHSGAQYFKRNEDRTFSNLLMREWESVFVTRTFGWQPYAEYRYSLIPHLPDMDNHDRLKLSAENDRGMIVRAGRPGEPVNTDPSSLYRIEGTGCMVTSFRKKGENTYETRLFETNGSCSEASVFLYFPVRGVYLTDLAGRRISKVNNTDGSFSYSLKPYQIATFEIIKK